MRQNMRRWWPLALMLLVVNALHVVGAQRSPRMGARRLLSMTVTTQSSTTVRSGSEQVLSESTTNVVQGEGEGEAERRRRRGGQKVNTELVQDKRRNQQRGNRRNPPPRQPRDPDTDDYAYDYDTDALSTDNADTNYADTNYADTNYADTDEQPCPDCPKNKPDDEPGDTDDQADDGSVTVTLQHPLVSWLGKR